MGRWSRRVKTGMGVCLAVLSCLGLAGCAGAGMSGVRRLDGRRLSSEQVDQHVERLMAAAKVPGLAVALIQDGQIVHLKAYGLKDTAERQPLTTSTVMYGASLTKAAFAYMVMQLVQEGALELDRPISTWLDKPLPEYEKYKDLAADPRWRLITPRMLLSHTSGLPNWRLTHPEGKLEILFEPGRRYSYSGEGINLLQLVVEQATGQEVGALMQARVFDRFGMTRTSMTWREDFATDFAVGYDEEGKPLGHKRRQSVRAAGSMDTTVTDYARFLAGVLRGEGLSRASREEMLRAQVPIHSVQQFPTTSERTTEDNRAIGLAYGLGWGLFESPHGKAYFKEGHEDGWRNYAVSFDQGRHALLLLANSSNGDSLFKYLVDALLGPTCMPWFWNAYIPYDRPELKSPQALEEPHPPCESEGGGRVDASPTLIR
ncbi:serine hydrolase [Vitiosangium sp. GDMCC 1.1324]|uniref:serine hydrolase domain-containing protein n=1 Tax=Vitiosangium sp. (strain GDMCC 1.1324) TaxID=2138576 RepID=UPI00130D5190|nr:serine hydrolase domain-containing protein [Vitiosangium sp. GDMCC 1.1324]